LDVTSAAGTSAGIELVVGLEYERRPGRVINFVRNPRQFLATGRTLSEALNALLAVVPDPETVERWEGHKVTWSESNGIVRVGHFAGRRTFLDETVPLFDVKDYTVVQLLTALHRITDPEHTEKTLSPGNPRSDPWLARRFTVSKRNSTVRELLDAIILTQGDLSWSVDYRSADGTYSKSVIAFHSFAGSGFARNAQR
jgi:hypothetical protein